MAATWLDSVVGELKTTGTLEALAFVECNYPALLNLGLDATNQVLQLFKSGKVDDALLVLEASLGPDDIIAAEQNNAMELAEKVAAWEKFKSELKNFAWSLAPIVAKVAVGAATGGLGI